MTHKEFQQRELLVRQLDFVAGSRRAAVDQVQYQVSELQPCRILRRRATLQGADAGEQFGKSKRLRDVVVRPRVQTFDFRLGAVHRGHDQNRRFDSHLTPVTRYVQAVSPRQRQIQDDQIDVFRLPGLEPDPPVISSLDLYTLFLKPALD